jgi:hypothetical protein
MAVWMQRLQITLFIDIIIPETFQNLPRNCVNV